MKLSNVQLSLGKLFALFVAGVLGALLLSNGLVVRAQSPSPSSGLPTDSQGIVTPAFYTIDNPGTFNLNINQEPFIPDHLSLDIKPNPERAIIDEDNRTPMMNREYPWSAIGKVEGIGDDEGQYHCTGTLVDRNIVMTNAHCVVNPNTHKLSQRMWFLPNMVDGSSPDRANVTNVLYGTDFTDNQRLDDWAFLVLDQPLGDEYGYLAWKAQSLLNLRNKAKSLSLVGYSGDFPKDPKDFPDFELTAGPGMTAGVHEECSVIGEARGTFLHDCDTTYGASGGPIIGEEGGYYYIAGLHAGYHEKGVSNYAVKISRIEEVLARLQARSR